LSKLSSALFDLASSVVGAGSAANV
jgi:hypothetical protein